MNKIMQLSDFEGNRAYAKTHADDDSVEGLTEFINSLIRNTSNNVDLTDYFTKEEIKQLLSESIKDSLKNYYTKGEIKELMATGTDLSDYYTKEQIDSIIDKIPKTDLSNYYTKANVDELIKQISSVDLSNYSTTEEMKTAISKAITDYKPDMSNYYDKTTVDSKIAGIELPDMSEYINKSDTLAAINNAISEKLSNYYNSKQTDDAIFKAVSDISGSDNPKIRTENTTNEYLCGSSKGNVSITKINGTVFLTAVFTSVNNGLINLINIPEWANIKEDVDMFVNAISDGEEYPVEITYMYLNMHTIVRAINSTNGIKNLTIVANYPAQNAD